MASEVVVPAPSAKFWPVMRPVLLIEKRVVVAACVEEPIAKRVAFVAPLFACTERSAKGLVVPTPKVPDVGNGIVVALVVAGREAKSRLPMLRKLLPDDDCGSALYPSRMLLYPVVTLLPPVLFRWPIMMLS